MAEEVQEQAKGKKKGALVAIVVLVAFLAIAGIAYSVLPSLRASAPYELTPAAEADQDLSKSLLASKVTDSGKETVTLEDLLKKSGKPLVINMWATWCPHCTVEMNDYQKLYDEYGDRIEFVMLNVVNNPGEAIAGRDYVKEQGFTFPVYYDTDGEVRNALTVTGIPVSAIVSADGNVVLNRPGEINYNAMKATIGKIV